MNTKMLKGMTAAVSLLTGIGAASPAMAGYTGAQLLGAVPTAIHVWTFTCPAGYGGRAQVNDLPNPNYAPAVQVVLGHDGNPTQQATDTTDDGAYSAFTPVISESDVYAMVVRKTGPAPEWYSGHGQCITPAGAISEPVLTLRINQ